VDICPQTGTDKLARDALSSGHGDILLESDRSSKLRYFHISIRNVQKTLGVTPTVKKHLKRCRRRWKDGFEMNFARRPIQRVEFMCISVVPFCKYGDEFTGFIKGGEFLY
jgi:hypothetical protein